MKSFRLGFCLGFQTLAQTLKPHPTGGLLRSFAVSLLSSLAAVLVSIHSIQLFLVSVFLDSTLLLRDRPLLTDTKYASALSDNVHLFVLEVPCGGLPALFFHGL